MPDKAWKRTERAIAKMFGGKRTGPTGKDMPDCIVNGWAIEVKERKFLPVWLLDAVDQCEHNAAIYAPENIPITVLHGLGNRHENDLVVMRLGKFMEWFGDPGWIGDLTDDDTTDITLVDDTLTEIDNTPMVRVD